MQSREHCNTSSPIMNQVAKKIWITDYGSEALVNHTLLEEFLAKNGWAIVNVQQVSTVELGGKIASASHIAGIANIVLPLVTTIGEMPGKIDVFTFTSLQKNNEASSQIIQQPFLHTVHTLPAQSAWATGNTAQWLLPNFSTICTVLDIQRSFDEIPAKVHPNSTLINTLIRAINADSYLEIGVDTGVTFLGVQAPKKVAVDPWYKCNFLAQPLANSEFFEMTSDDFFNYIADQYVFDLIFLDGLHTFEQTFRDFNSSQVCTNANTLWLIDDTVPCDEYSMITVQRDAYNERLTHTGVKNWAWHGDVCKIPFTLHDYFPNFCYCTIINSGNPKTLVWHKSRAQNANAYAKYVAKFADTVPLYDSINPIVSLSYDDFKKHYAIVHPVSLQEALDLLG